MSPRIVFAACAIGALARLTVTRSVSRLPVEDFRWAPEPKNCPVPGKNEALSLGVASSRGAHLASGCGVANDPAAPPARSRDRVERADQPPSREVRSGVSQPAKSK